MHFATGLSRLKNNNYYGRGGGQCHQGLQASQEVRLRSFWLGFYGSTRQKQRRSCCQT